MSDPGSPDCWRTAAKFEANGDSEGAIALCSSDSCADVLECQNYLGWSYYQKGDLTSAREWFARAAERNDADAFYGMACVRYCEGNYREALENFMSAAKNGNPRAFHWIGYIHHKGLGVPVNEELAAGFYEKGAFAGFLVAQHGVNRLALRNRSLLKKTLVLPAVIRLVFRTAFIIARDAQDPRAADFLKLGASINFRAH